VDRGASIEPRAAVLSSCLSRERRDDACPIRGAIRNRRRRSCPTLGRTTPRTPAERGGTAGVLAHKRRCRPRNTRRSPIYWKMTILSGSKSGIGDRRLTGHLQSSVSGPSGSWQTMAWIVHRSAVARVSSSLPGTGDWPWCWPRPRDAPGSGTSYAASGFAGYMFWHTPRRGNGPQGVIGAPYGRIKNGLASLNRTASRTCRSPAVLKAALMPSAGGYSANCSNSCVLGPWTPLWFHFEITEGETK
jgi:hypothetical protein